MTLFERMCDMSLFPAYGELVGFKEDQVSNAENRLSSHEITEAMEVQLLSSDVEEDTVAHDRSCKPLLQPTLSSDDFYLDCKVDYGNLHVSTLYYPGRPQYNYTNSGTIGSKQSKKDEKKRWKRYFSKEIIDESGSLTERLIAYRKLLAETPDDLQLWEAYIDFREVCESVEGALEAVREAAGRLPDSVRLRERLFDLMQTALPRRRATPGGPHGDVGQTRRGRGGGGRGDGHGAGGPGRLRSTPGRLATTAARLRARPAFGGALGEAGAGHRAARGHEPSLARLPARAFRRRRGRATSARPRGRGRPQRIARRRGVDARGASAGRGPLAPGRPSRVGRRPAARAPAGRRGGPATAHRRRRRPRRPRGAAAVARQGAPATGDGGGGAGARRAGRYGGGPARALGGAGPAGRRAVDGGRSGGARRSAALLRRRHRVRQLGVGAVGGVLLGVRRQPARGSRLLAAAMVAGAAAGRAAGPPRRASRAATPGTRRSEAVGGDFADGVRRVRAAGGGRGARRGRRGRRGEGEGGGSACPARRHRRRRRAPRGRALRGQGDERSVRSGSRRVRDGVRGAAPPAAASRAAALSACEQRCAELERRLGETTEEETTDLTSFLRPSSTEWARARVALASPARRRELLARLLHAQADVANTEGEALRYYEETASELVRRGAAAGAEHRLARLFPGNAHLNLASASARRTPSVQWRLSAVAPPRSPTAALASLLPTFLRASHRDWPPVETARAVRAARRATGGAGGVASGGAAWAARLEAEARAADPKTKRALLTALQLTPHDKWLHVRGARCCGEEAEVLADALLEKQLRLHALPDELRSLDGPPASEVS
ncbi:uncharacterized protein LOC110997685 isoform X3 [Pieris rapae]|uniref:uncharacterized protein LOC110997685 isoform X3 n=1 Tax=Pieris rapae TaxID=64459 RepID=UPI001E27F4FD|nr:uncharacterized protein LOC110997685 isoform X3 [Pieris rapae]